MLAMAKKHWIPKTEFDLLKRTLLAEHRFSKENIDAAYAYFVEGKSLSIIAKERGITVQGLYIPMRRILEIYQSIRSLPEEWVKVVVILPPDMATAVFQMEKAALAGLKKA